MEKKATIVSAELLESGLIRTITVSNYSLGKIGEISNNDDKNPSL